MVLPTFSVAFSQAWKGTKQKHHKISSSILFSQKDKSNLCNKEYLFQSKEIFECDVLKKILKMANNHRSPSVLFADFIIRLLHCAFLDGQPVTLFWMKRVLDSEIIYFTRRWGLLCQILDSEQIAQHAAALLLFLCRSQILRTGLTKDTQANVLFPWTTGLTEISSCFRSKDNGWNKTDFSGRTSSINIFFYPLWVVLMLKYFLTVNYF